MPMPRAVARFNKRVTNPIQSRWAGTLPLYGIIHHVGRKSGAEYRVPVSIWSAPGKVAVALIYGRNSDWVRNVEAAGSASIQHRGRMHTLTNPTVIESTDLGTLGFGPIVRRLCRAAEYTFVADMT